MIRVPRDKHGLAREAISPAAAKVCAVLREAGFSAYVVGGAVRDLLLGLRPKDFDVATNATPEQVKALFRRILRARKRIDIVVDSVAGEDPLMGMYGFLWQADLTKAAATFPRAASAAVPKKCSSGRAIEVREQIGRT